MAILKDMSTILNDNLADDRYAIPTIEFLAFLIDGFISTIPEGMEPTYVCNIAKIPVTDTSRSGSEKYSFLCKRHISSRPTFLDSKLP